MTTDTEEPTGAKLLVEFHSSTVKGASEAYTVRVLEGADPEEAQRVFTLAAELRRKALEELAPSAKAPTETEKQLEESIDAVKRNRLIDEADAVLAKKGANQA